MRMRGPCDCISPVRSEVSEMRQGLSVESQATERALTWLPRRWTTHATYSYVLGIDVDASALKTALENLEEAEVEEQIDFVLADVAQLNDNSALLERLKSEWHVQA